jgi:hypothetical protein
MPLGQLLKARTNRRGARLPAVLQILETLLPEFLDIRKMTDVLSNGPLPLELKSSAGVVHPDKERVKSRQRAAKALDEELADALDALSSGGHVPKCMRWGSGRQMEIPIRLRIPKKNVPAIRCLAHENTGVLVKEGLQLEQGEQLNA